MKTSTKIIITCIASILLVCGFIVVGINFIGNKNSVKDLIINSNNITLEVGQEINLKNYFSLSPTTSKATVMCLIENSTYAKISDDYMLTAKNIGETKIILKVNTGSNNYIEKNINVIITEKSIIPSSISFEKTSVSLGKNTTTCTNKLIASGEYNVAPKISYTNSNVCTYNYKTGLITPINYGSTKITVTFSLNEKIVFNSFDVTICDEYRTISVDLPTLYNFYILNVQPNELKSINIITKENDIETEFAIKQEFISNNNNSQIVSSEFSNILVKATMSGESILKVFCKDDENIFILIKIIVEE